ncbi:hypothetical protein EJ02DRAFT_228551 [Clathrospora elynae]|uniref:Uncharacterized protein n=1 Tax=Clathrospora elynae TaxID=706981 RepID=A0A6A5SLG0_9PLEO|nr:hypothetical protein EJ02DRAFT_228551 [Clathrospora elynae]
MARQYLSLTQTCSRLRDESLPLYHAQVDLPVSIHIRYIHPYIHFFLLTPACMLAQTPRTTAKIHVIMREKNAVDTYPLGPLIQLYPRTENARWWDYFCHCVERVFIQVDRGEMEMLYITVGAECALLWMWDEDGGREREMDVGRDKIGLPWGPWIVGRVSS